MPPKTKDGKRYPSETPPRTRPEDLPPQPIDDYPPRLPTETIAAYARFCEFCQQKHPRPKVTAGLHRKWSAAYLWRERASRFDAAQRKHRLALLTEAQLERDILTLEADGRLADLARGLLLGAVPPPADDAPGPLLHVLDQVARAGNRDADRLAAVRDLVEFSGISDLRKLRAKQLALPFTAPPASAPAAPALGEVVNALAQHATPEQLDALCGGPVVDDPGGAGG